MEVRAKVVGRDLEKINGWFNHHRGEVNCLKIMEKDTKEEVERLKGFVVGVRKLDLSHLCFSLNFCFLMILHNFLLCFPY